MLTTGTGSGKSLTYLIPIVDRVLRNGGKQGIQAVVVYPMNALCNSQYGELEKFLRVGFGLGREPVRFDRYTGQESREQRDRIIQNPPEILLTNYVMLELLLTRPFERRLTLAISASRARRTAHLPRAAGLEAGTQLVIDSSRVPVSAPGYLHAPGSPFSSGEGAWPKPPVCRLWLRGHHT